MKRKDSGYILETAISRHLRSCWKTGKCTKTTWIHPLIGSCTSLWGRVSLSLCCLSPLSCHSYTTPHPGHLSLLDDTKIFLPMASVPALSWAWNASPSTRRTPHQANCYLRFQLTSSAAPPWGPKIESPPPPYQHPQFFRAQRTTVANYVSLIICLCPS